MYSLSLKRHLKPPKKRHLLYSILFLFERRRRRRRRLSKSARRRVENVVAFVTTTPPVLFFLFGGVEKREGETTRFQRFVVRPIFERHILTRETVKRKDTIGERHISCLDSNASTPRVRLRDDIHFFFPFLLSLSSLSFLSEHKHSATVVVVYVVVYAFFFAFLFDFCYYLLGVSLSFKSHFACIETTPPPMTTRY